MKGTLTRMSTKHDTKRATKHNAKSELKNVGAAAAATEEPILPKGVKIYPIVKFGDPVLDRRADLITKFDDEMRQLCADMFISMYAANGVGLAAPQIGLGLQLSVIDTTMGKNPEAKIVIANPEIIHSEGEQREEEGCLSLPGFRASVLRPLFVTVRAKDAFGKEFEMRGENMLARAFCHEIDHLHGVVFIQHVSMLKRDLIKRRIRKMRKAGDW
jgi:peptide deformylase